jgi:hypothetical protein
LGLISSLFPAHLGLEDFSKKCGQNVVKMWSKCGHLISHEKMWSKCGQNVVFFQAYFRLIWGLFGAQ